MSEAEATPLQVGILLFPGYEPLDAIGPAQVFWTLASVRPYVPPFREVEVHLVAATTDPVVAAYGFTVHPTTSFETCPALDVLIVAGGSGGGDGAEATRAVGSGTESHFGRHYYWTHEPTLEFVRRQDAGTTITASVCTGAFILAGAGLLAGHRATTHWMARDELLTRMTERDEPFVLANERVVDDGHIVSAGGVSSGIALGFHVVERLFGTEVRDAVYLGIEMETPAGNLV
jgi:cyclohexyl-isocyanide hydratase